MKAATLARIRRTTLWASVVSLMALAYMTWFVAPDWSYQPDVTAPLTR